MNKFFLEFAQATRKHFTDDKIYRYDFNQILLVLNINDVRTVNKVLSNYFSVINHLESNVLKFEEFKVNAGVLRYPVVTSEKNIDKIYRYLDIALLKSLQNKQNFIDFTFSYRSEERRVGKECRSRWSTYH